MSLHYILDGYNILNQIPSSARRKLEDDREQLISLIKIHRPQGSTKNAVTIVFDGKSGMIAPERPPSVKVIFSEGESADDKIRRLVSESGQKKQTIVVTDDKELRFSIRALGADVLGVQDFLAKAKNEKLMFNAGKKQKEKRDDPKNISKALEYKINSEFEKIWLGK